ncbi:MAG: adenylyltransferase/cytidyltransferase family protein [Acidimicrobiia bacterium]|nr:adenylyltransferase/cytidyltransferase family protein [Acidimicrobiia bacterium]
MNNPGDPTTDHAPVGVLVSGYFSPLHVGHLDMIEAAAAEGDRLIVIVNNNDQQIAKKGKLIIDEQDRLRLVKALAVVDDAFIAVDNDRTVTESIRLAAQKYPDHRLIFANGGDRKPEFVPESAVCEELGVEMRFGVGGDEKADSSTRINMELGLETEASAPPSTNT